MFNDERAKGVPSSSQLPGQVFQQGVEEDQCVCTCDKWNSGDFSLQNQLLRIFGQEFAVGTREKRKIQRLRGYGSIKRCMRETYE